MQRLIAFAIAALTALPALAWEKDGLRLRGRVMVRYQLEDEKHNVGRWTDTIDLYRARLDARWRPNDDLSLWLETELARGPRVKDAFARYRVHDAFRISAGQMKKPFSRLRRTRRWDLVIPRRGLVDRHVVGHGPFGGFGARDPGVMVSGRFGETGLKLRYFAGVFDGFDVNDAFFKDPDDPDNEPNASHRDYVGRLQLRVISGLVLAFSFNHKRAGVLLTTGREETKAFNLLEADLRWTIGGLRLMVEGVWGDNPRAIEGHKLLGGHATLSYTAQIDDDFAVIPALMVEGLDPDDTIDGGAATRFAGAVSFDLGDFVRLMLAFEAGKDAYRWEEPEYLTEDNLEPELESRTVPTRVTLQLNVSI